MRHCATGGDDGAARAGGAGWTQKSHSARTLLRSLQVKMGVMDEVKKIRTSSMRCTLSGWLKGLAFRVYGLGLTAAPHRAEAR